MPLPCASVLTHVVPTPSCACAWPAQPSAEDERYASDQSLVRFHGFHDGPPCFGHKDCARRSEFQRRSNVDDAIQPVRQKLILRRASAEVLASLFKITKELLDAPRGRKSDEDASRPRTVVDKRVGNAPRAENRIAWLQSKPLIADFNDVCSGKAVEPLRLALRGSAWADLIHGGRSSCSVTERARHRCLGSRP